MKIQEEYGLVTSSLLEEGGHQPNKFQKNYYWKTQKAFIKIKGENFTESKGVKIWKKNLLSLLK